MQNVDVKGFSGQAYTAYIAFKSKQAHRRGRNAADTTDGALFSSFYQMRSTFSFYISLTWFQPDVGSLTFSFVRPNPDWVIKAQVVTTHLSVFCMPRGENGVIGAIGWNAAAGLDDCPFLGSNVQSHDSFDVRRWRGFAWGAAVAEVERSGAETSGTRCHQKYTCDLRNSPHNWLLCQRSACRFIRPLPCDGDHAMWWGRQRSGTSAGFVERMGEYVCIFFD